MVDYLLGGQHSAALGQILEHPEVDLHVPSLCDVEVTAALRRLLLSGALKETRATEALEDYLDLPLTRHGHGTLLGGALRLRRNFSAYDAIYVVLALGLDAELLSADPSLLRAVEKQLQVTGIPLG